MEPVRGPGKGKGPPGSELGRISDAYGLRQAGKAGQRTRAVAGHASRAGVKASLDGARQVVQPALGVGAGDDREA